MRVALAAMVLSSTGCGVSTLERESYELEGALSAALAKVAERQEALTKLVSEAPSDAVAKETLAAWSEKREAAQRAMAARGSGLDGDEISKLAAAVAALDEASEAVLMQISRDPKVMTVGDVQVRSLEEKAARTEEIAARKRYGITAANYNEIIEVMPLKWTAAMMGKRAVPDLEGTDHQAGNLARKMIDLATGKSEPLKAH